MSVNASMENAARNDALNYVYDQFLDPRYSNDAQSAISNLSQGVSLEASRRAAAGEGQYDAILQQLMNQTGLSEGGYSDYIQRLKDTGSLGIRDMNGNLLDNELSHGNFGKYYVTNGRLTEPWEGVELNMDGTYTIFNNDDLNQKRQARINALNGGTALDLSANDPRHNDEYWAAVDRYNTLVGQGYNYRNPNQANVGSAGVIAAMSNNNGNAAQGADAGAAASGGSGAGAYSGGGYSSYGSAPRTVQNTAYRRSSSPYSSALRNAQEEFSWNKEEDPSYQAYKDTYERAANQATANALGQIAGRTGGMASSYATQAAQQSYNNQMQNLDNLVPELYQDAYGRFTTERAYNDAQEEKAYQRQLQQEQTNYERNLAAQQMAQQQQASNYSNLLNLMTKFGYMPSESELAAAGMNGNIMNAILGLGQYAAQQATATGGTTQNPKQNPVQNPINEPENEPKQDPINNSLSALSGLNAGTDSQYYTYLQQAKSMTPSQKTAFIANLLKAGLISEIQGDQLLSRMGL